MKKKQKFIFLIGIILSVILILSITFINFRDPKEAKITLITQNITRNPNTESSLKSDLSFEYYLKNCTDCVIGTYQGFTKCDNNIIDYEFKVTDKIFTSHNDNTIKVRIQNYGNSTDGGITPDTFKLNHEYLLPLYGQHSLFLEYTAYSIMGSMIIDINNLSDAYWSFGIIEIEDNVTKNDLIYTVKNIDAVEGHYEPYQIKIFRTEDVETVIKNCDAVYKIKKNFKLADGTYKNFSSYECALLEVYKGPGNVKSDVNLLIRTLTYALDEGDEFILALSFNDKNTRYLDQASPICIFDADDIEMETKIKEWLSEKNTVNG